MSQGPDTERTTTTGVPTVDLEEIVPIDVARVRFSGERAAADRVRSDPWLRDLVVAADARGRNDSARARRQLMARGARVTEGMAPDVWAAARLAADRLEVHGPLEIHHAGPLKNAAIHLVEEPVLLEIRARLLPLLDRASTVAALGQELGHYLAHGPGSKNGALGLVVTTALEHGSAPSSAVRAASALAMCREITCDRFGLLACRDLSAALRLEMAVTTGLALDALTWDTAAYLEQCKALIASALQAGGPVGDHADRHTFPEHGLRAWALWLFSETDLYQDLTGEGPGTRSLPEVDAQILEALGVAPAEGLVDSALVLDPIPEVHECALASAALVALSDGDLSDEEIVAIEKVFAPIVGDWQRYLVWDNALEAFIDTQSVVRAGGPTVQRSVFQVLVHVLAADAEIEAREIEMVCAIGDAMEAGALYRALLDPVLKAFGEESRDLSKVQESIPMPARSAEAENALEVFLRGIHRRGGGEATLRRMFRLLGDRDGTDSSQATLTRLMDEVGLTTEVDLDQTALDHPVLFTPTDDYEADAYETMSTVRMEVEPSKDSARHRLSKGLIRLKESLVSGDGRSPAVRLRETRRGRSFDMYELERMSVGHGERVLTLVEATEPARVVDGREVGVHEVADRVSRQLIALQREAVARYEQTGARDLYVGYPFLTGMIDGYLVRAPLVLYPYELDRTDTRSFQLAPRTGDARIVNQALLRLVFGKKGLPFPDELGLALDRAALDSVDAVHQLLSDEGLRARTEGEDLQAFNGRGPELEGWLDGRMVLEPCAVLGFFPQSTSDMIADYDDLLTAVADPRVPLADKLGAAGPLLPVDLREELVVSEEWDVPEDAPPIVEVVPADPSQRSVLLRARTKRALVVDGPPGTGKSQVIVNLVADALSQGQTVAVVCEKRAALDVVAQRLEQIGLGHLVAVVHDVHDDRRALYSHVVTRLGEGHLRDLDEVGAERTADDLRSVMNQLAQRRSALLTALGDERPSLGQLHLLASSFEGLPITKLDPELVQLAPRDMQRLADRVGREAHHADLHDAGSVWRAPQGEPDRPSLAEADETLLAGVQDALRASRSTASALGSLQDKQGVRASQVQPAAEAIRAVLGTAPLRTDRPSRELMMAWLTRGDDPALASMVRRVENAWADVADWQSAAPEQATFELTHEVETAMSVVRTMGVSFFRWFSMAWWRARGVVRRALAAQWPAAASSSVDLGLMERMEQRAEGASAWNQLRKLLEVLKIDPVIPDTASACVWVERLVESFEATRSIVEAEDRLRYAEAWPETLRAGAFDAWDATLQDRLALLEAAKQHRETFEPAHGHFPWLEPAPSHSEVMALHEAWAIDAPRVVTSDHNLDLATELFAGARSVVQHLADVRGEADASEWSDALEHGWAQAAIDQVERRHPETRMLDRVSAADVVKAEGQLARLIAKRGEYHVQTIVDRADRVPLLTEARPEKGRTRTPLQKSREQMLREARKRRFILSLRGFVRQFSDQGLMDLLPVWLVSPETVAVLFPGRPVFDLVVMDEASQCTVEKGLPALMRGHRAVIAGDDKQMPPTSFFELRHQMEEDETGTEDNIEADALTAESLLVLARERCVHEGLRWHYRCLREELIAFSNHAMYGGDLFTIPSTATGRATPALRWESVEDATYDQGVNLLEADRVVEVLAELLASDDAPSVGIVTFNIQQRQAIQDAIDVRMERDSDFSAHYVAAQGHEELDRRPFVKNLEAVQGDERDVIIFSLGHAPLTRASGESYVPARFGPLGQAGGERRLNVAVSRAKRECIVVASFHPAMLSVANTKHSGPKLLKAFLQYAWDLTHGRRMQADKTLERVRHGSLGDVPLRQPKPILTMPPLAAQVAARLDAEGVTYDMEVGTSGFRVPLAIIDPEDPNVYKVAVLTDTGDRQSDVIEAHLHQPRVLVARGWEVVRVDSREWHRDPAAVIGRIMEALHHSDAEGDA
ncbi:MAG: DUF4011 domain-containing protein [Myxococcales bacterium]|nr:DUF4011 domain-containing protein [Myxococcales bacterium]